MNLPAPPKTIHRHKGCGGIIGYDAWVDSLGEVCGGPYDNAQCMECGEDVGFREVDKNGAPEEDEGGGRGMKLTTRELGTVLAALRWLQSRLTNKDSDDRYDEIWSEIATDGGMQLPLSAKEIDRLCERLNTGE